MNTKHTVTSRREIARAETKIGAMTRKTVTEELNHGGQKGVCVRTEDGFMAWGFGATWEAAEIDAVKKAEALC